jgi:hypothetical protein
MQLEKMKKDEKQKLIIFVKFALLNFMLDYLSLLFASVWEEGELMEENHRHLIK